MNKTTQIITTAALVLTVQAKADLTGTLETRFVTKTDFTEGASTSNKTTYIPKLTLRTQLFEGGSLFVSAAQEIGAKGSTWYQSKYHAGVVLTAGSFVVIPGVRYSTFPDGKDGRDAVSTTGKIVYNNSTVWSPYITTEQYTNPKIGSWYEAGLTPNKTFGKLVLSAPLSIGTRLTNYQLTNPEQTYGYIGAGLAASLSLTDHLTLKAGSTYYTTNCQVKTFDRGQWTNQAGVSVSF